MKVEQLGATFDKMTIVAPVAANQPLTFAINGTDGYDISLATDGAGVVTTKWSEVVTLINNNPTLKALYKAELVGADADATGVTVVDIPTDGTAAVSEQTIQVTLTFDAALTAGTNGVVTIDGNDYTIATINAAATQVVDLGAGVTTATKVTALDNNFVNANGSAVVVPAAGVTITQ